MSGLHLDAAGLSTLFGVRVSIAWYAGRLVASTSLRDVTSFSRLAVNAGFDGVRTLWRRVLSSRAIEATRLEGQARHVAPLARCARFAFELSKLVLVLAWVTRIACRGDAGTGGDATCGAFGALEGTTIRCDYYLRS